MSAAPEPRNDQEQQGHHNQGQARQAGLFDHGAARITLPRPPMQGVDVVRDLEVAEAVVGTPKEKLRHLGEKKSWF